MITDITYLAKLAHLSLADGECRSLENDLAAMVAFVDRISAEEIDERADICVFPSEPIVREDTPGEVLDRELLLSSAETVYEGYIAVPHVSEEVSDAFLA